MSESSQKTQILITDVSPQEFSRGWPQELESLLFEREFPQFKKNCEYYTPLAFLHRIVIIFDQEAATLQVHNYLAKTLASKPVKVYLTESLITKSRARSFDEADFNADVAGATHTKPKLSLDTCESTVNAPSLSPVRSDPHSPTAIKSLEDGKIHFYQEPLPKLDSPTYSGSPPGETKLLYKPRLSLDTKHINQATPTLSTPISPSITLNEFPQ